MEQLEVKNLSFEIPDRRLMNGVSLVAEPGECICIVGPSGSGKTSLLNCLCGITMPTSGVVRVNGVEVTGLSLSRRSVFRLQHIGMVFQFGELLPELTALENVALPLRLIGVSRHEAEDRAETWLERLGLGGRGGAHADILSGGEVQRVGIARALAHKPSLVLADEPTGALDEINSMHIIELLVGMAKELDSTVVMATHDPLVASQADRVFRLFDGHLTPVDDADSVVRGR